MPETPVHNRFGMPIPPLVNAFTHPQARREVFDLLRSVGTSLGLRLADAEAFPGLIHRILADGSSTAERTIRDWIRRKALAPDIVTEIDARSAQICSQIAPYVVGPLIADVGCGDGLVAAALGDRHDIFLIDVVKYVDSRVRLPFFHYSGRDALPLNAPVDCSLLLTVLHHSDDPGHLLTETMRVTKKRIVAIESVVPEVEAPDFEAQFLVAALFDWLYNRVIHEGVPVPFNYNSIRGWHAMFDQQEWHVVQVVDLGRDQRLVPERHVLFVLDRLASIE